MHLPQLRRIRWAVRAALALGVAASVAANILNARPNPISQAIAGWPPLALLLTVELTSRIPMHRRSLAAARVSATVAIACIAAWVSYWHMKSVAVRYGETEMSAYLLPISVDGLIVVASVSLVELAGRIRLVEDHRAKAAAGSGRPASSPAPVPGPQPVRFVEPVPAMLTTTAARPVATQAATSPQGAAPATVGSPRPGTGSPLAPNSPLAPASSPATEVAMDAADADATPVSPALPPMHPRATVPSTVPTGQPAPGGDRRGLGELGELGASVPAARPATDHVNGSTPRPRPPAARPAVSTPTRTVVTAPTRAAADTSGPKQRRPIQETAELADAIEAMHPDISPAELAKQIGISATRLRAVRREAREARRSGRPR